MFKKANVLLASKLLFPALLASFFTSACGKSKPSAAASEPPPTAVKLQLLKSSQVQEVSEFVGRLEAQQRVSLQPEIQGRIESIPVSSGDRVQQGTPIVLLRPDRADPELNSAIARVNSVKCAYGTAQAQLKAQEAQRLRDVADVELQTVQFQRAQQLVCVGAAAPIIFGLAFVMVFLVLAAQYESYIDPTIIMITVPLAILGALGAIVFRANVFQQGGVWPTLNNNIYAQVALVMLIGLASKNAILIVEFANQLVELGMNITKAAIRASEERLRPILMTAISGFVGFWPLVIASGAGAMSRWSLGTALFGGYLISTILSLFLVPVLYVVIKNLEESFLKPGKPGKSSSTEYP